VGLTTAVLGVLTLCIVQGGKVAASPQAAAPVADPRPVTAPWQIAGVGLGMAPVDVEAALRAAGYKLAHRYDGRSWQGEVANQVSNLRSIRIPPGSRVITKEDYRKGQEQVQVLYLAGKAGAYVSRVNYSISVDAIDAERFKAAALAKYGKPTLRWDWESLYCSARERQCSRTSGPVANQLPSLTVYVASATQRVLQLRQGERADKAYWAAVRAEAERLYPKTNKPTF
jgi:hypothetical protein